MRSLKSRNIPELNLKHKQRTLAQTTTLQTYDLKIFQLFILVENSPMLRMWWTFQLPIWCNRKIKILYNSSSAKSPRCKLGWFYSAVYLAKYMRNNTILKHHGYRQYPLHKRIHRLSQRSALATGFVMFLKSVGFKKHSVRKCFLY